MTDEIDTSGEEQPADSEQDDPVEGTPEEMDWDGVAGEQEDGVAEGPEDAFPAATDDGTSGPRDPEDDPIVPDQGTDEGPVPADDEAFDDMAVDEVEADEVWADVAESEEESGETTPEESPVETNVAAVSKHDYCESCEYFSEAPEIHCTHDGTEILDFVDMSTVRVSNCPIVAERRGLRKGVSEGSTDVGEIQRE